MASSPNKSSKELQNDAVEMVVVGRNDVFKKDYVFKELKLSIHLDVHVPTIRERARVMSLRQEIFFNTEQDPYTKRVFDMLFLIQESGKKTTVFELDDSGQEYRELVDYFSVDKYPREDVLLFISDDVNEWLNRFRG